MTEIAPVREERRIKSLDVMRGFALLGILIVNAAFFAAPWQASQNPMLAPLAVTGETLWSWAIMHVFFEFKCLTLFSLLFGASICLVGGELGDPMRGHILIRRLLWLLVFGLAHAWLIWSGDILVTYALVGLIVMSARSMSAAALLRAGVVLLLAALWLESWFGVVFNSLSASDVADVKAWAWAPPPAELARVQAAYQGGLISATRENFSIWWQFISTGFVTLGARTAGVMLVGMALLKLGFLSGKAPTWSYWLALAVGGVCLALIGAQAWLNWQAGFDFAYVQTRGRLANNALTIFVSIAYAALFVLLVKAGVRLITEPLAAVGRMAFTNYITQSLIMTTIFWGGRGLGLYGEIDRPTLMAIVAAVWALQLVWSPLWLSRFQMGPLEWLWRRLSYGKPVAMAKAAPA